MGDFDINLTDTEVFWSSLLLGFGQSIAFSPIAFGFMASAGVAVPLAGFMHRMRREE